MKKNEISLWKEYCDEIDKNNEPYLKDWMKAMDELGDAMCESPKDIRFYRSWDIKCSILEMRVKGYGFLIKSPTYEGFLNWQLERQEKV